MEKDKKKYELLKLKTERNSFDIGWGPGDVNWVVCQIGNRPDDEVLAYSVDSKGWLHCDACDKRADWAHCQAEAHEDLVSKARSAWWPTFPTFKASPPCSPKADSPSQGERLGGLDFFSIEKNVYQTYFAKKRKRVTKQTVSRLYVRWFFFWNVVRQTFETLSKALNKRLDNLCPPVSFAGFFTPTCGICLRQSQKPLSTKTCEQTVPKRETDIKNNDRKTKRQ